LHLVVLETAYDDNKKLKSLIHWIEEWEKDGVTKIDGIGSQMHVSCCMDPVEQKKREDAIVLNERVVREERRYPDRRLFY
jgi:GH35 family endo-1,4-beta-xylanase